jgi:DNA-directed RNA polymerase subunit RPC12/RpoP
MILVTTILVPYTCGKCKNQINVTMKVGEPLISRTCPKCGGIANAPDVP